MLIASPRHTRADLEHWRRCEERDRSYLAHCGARLDQLTAAATAAICDFAAAGGCYLGTSWGKDSVTVLHLARAVPIPVVWVRVDGQENPDCPLVRDAFLARWPVDYHEIAAPSGVAEGKRTSSLGFQEAARRFGARHISGVRAEESTTRAIAVSRYGVASVGSCRPIARWTALDVFGYAARHDLPIHPAYACTFGGMLDRGRVRVGALGGERGTGRGRAEWEARYYGRSNAPENARLRDSSDFDLR